MAEIKKISTELQLLDKFLDTSGDAGTSGQVLTSTGTGINWVSGGSLPGGPYLPLAGGTMANTNLVTNMNADLLDGQQGSYYVNTSTAQSIAGVKSFSGKIGADGGIDGLTQANGGITGSNYDITGVNQLVISDPGEGIVFTGTATMYLNAVDDATDSILKLTNATQLNLNSTARITSLVDPSGAQDAATKNYVDTEIGNIPSGLAFEGNWNASTDTPTLAGTTQDNGKFWIVSVAGSTNLSGITDWAVGDWAIYVDNGAGTDAWQKVDNSSSLAGQGAAGKVTFWSSTSNVSFNTNFSYDGTYLTAPRMRVGDGTDGYFYSDLAGRTAFASGDFYIQSSVNNYYNYATNIYLGDTTGDSVLFRGSTITGTNWGITPAGLITAASGFTTVSGKGYSIGSSRIVYYDGTTYLGNIDNQGSGSTVIRSAGNNTLTLDTSNNANFAGDLTVSGGDITLGGTGRIQGVDTVSASTDAANKAYVDAHGGGLGPFLPIANPTFTGTLSGPAATITTVTGALVGNATTATTASNANLLDNLDSTQFLRSDAADVSTQRITFTANDTNNWDTIATASGSQGGIEIFNNGAGNDAFMAFHAGNDYAFYFGIDADNNQLSVGGWSMGANKYKVWNESNDGAGSGLDADLLDGQQGSYYLAYANFTGTPTIPSVGNGTLTMTTSTGLDGDATFTANQSGNSTFAVTLDLTEISLGAGLDSTATGLTLDLSEFTDMTAGMTATDEFIVLDSGEERRKAAGEIGLSIFNNDAGFITSSSIPSVGNGTLTVQGTTGLAGSGTFTANQSGNTTITLTNSAPNIVQTTVSGNAGSATVLQTARTIAGVSFNGSADISLNNNAITNGAGYITSASLPTVGNGQINGATSGLGLSGSMSATANQSGNTTFTVTSNATTAATASTIAYRDGSADINVRLLRANYANQSTISGAMAFRVNNSTDNYTRYCSDPAAIRTWLGAGTSSTAGTVTSVTAGSGMTQTGTSTVNPTLNVIGGTGITANADDVAITYVGSGNAILAATDSSGTTMSTGAKIWFSDDGTIAQANVSDLPFTNTAGTVTGVGGTAPIVSSGGTVPAISITAATTGAAGSMSATDKAKLDGIAAGAQVNVGTNIAQGTRTTTTVPVTSSTGTNATLAAATTSLAGVMTSADKTKLNGIAAGANTGTVTSVGGTGTVSGLTLTGTVTSSGNLTLGGTLTLTSGNITTGLGFTPYNATNPAGYTTNTGTVTGTGTTNYVSKFTSASDIENSVIYDDGTNVGINTTTPQQLLQVLGTTEGYIMVQGASDSGKAGIYFKKEDTTGTMNRTKGLILFHSNVGSGWGRGHLGFCLNSADSNAQASIFDEKFRMVDNGDFLADGDVVAYSTTISDARYKTNIQPIESALDKVNKMRGVSFDWTAVRSGREFGVIAQEIEQIAPELVSEKELLNGDTMKTVSYTSLVPFLIESIKELTAKVEALETKINQQ